MSHTGGGPKLNDSIILEARELAFGRRVRRGSSKIWHLGDELFTDAVKAYLDGVSFAKIRAMLGEAGIAEADLPSQTAWVRFWGRFRPFLTVARRKAAAQDADAVAAAARKSPADFDEASIELIRQMIFELAASGAADPRELSMLMSLVIKYKDQRLKERMVEVAERRVALAEKRCPDRPKQDRPKEDWKPMPHEEWKRRMKAIFGISDEEWERHWREVEQRRLNGGADCDVGDGEEGEGEVFRETTLNTHEHHETPSDIEGEEDGVSSQWPGQRCGNGETDYDVGDEEEEGEDVGSRDSI